MSENMKQPELWIVDGNASFEEVCIHNQAIENCRAYYEPKLERAREALKIISENYYDSACNLGLIAREALKEIE